MMQFNVPTINFCGAFLVNSLEVGSLLIRSKRFSAVRIQFHHTLNYSLLAYENSAAEIYAYCFDAYQNGQSKLEAYAPCYMLKDQHSQNQTLVVASITWYVPPDLHTRCAEQVATVLSGDVLGDAAYPLFVGKPFAVFNAG